MLLIPVINLKEGRCVCPYEPQVSTVKQAILTEDPVAMVRYWLEQGANRIHIMDLNGAYGKNKNEAAIKAIIQAVRQYEEENDIEEIPLQLAGGIRDLDTIEKYTDAGIAYIVIGTAAVKSPGFLADACSAFPGQIIVGLDAKEGKVVTDGWSKMSGHDVIDLAKKFEHYGIEAVVYTDKGIDGFSQKVNREATLRLAQAIDAPVIVAAAVDSLADLDAVRHMEDDGVVAVICDQSLYTGQLDFAEAQEKLDAES